MKRFTLAVLTLGIFTVAYAEFAILDPYGKPGIGGVDANGNYKRVLVGADGSILTNLSTSVSTTNATINGTVTVAPPSTATWVTNATIQGSSAPNLGVSRPLIIYQAGDQMSTVGDRTGVLVGAIRAVGTPVWLMLRAEDHGTNSSGDLNIHISTAANTFDGSNHAVWAAIDPANRVVYAIGQSSAQQIGTYTVTPGSGVWSTAGPFNPGSTVYMVGHTSVTVEDRLSGTYVVGQVTATITSAYVIGQSSVVPSTDRPLYMAASTAVYVIGQTSVTIAGSLPTGTNSVGNVGISSITGQAPLSVEDNAFHMVYRSTVVATNQSISAGSTLVLSVLPAGSHMAFLTIRVSTTAASSPADDDARIQVFDPTASKFLLDVSASDLSTVFNGVTTAGAREIRALSLATDDKAIAWEPAMSFHIPNAVRVQVKADATSGGMRVNGYFVSWRE